MASSISESMVTFFRANGHSHDGVASSLIDTTKYSVFDFNISTASPFNDSTVQKRRYLNKINFDSYIVNLINENLDDSVYIVNKIIQNPTITAGEIGTIVSDFVSTFTAQDSTTITMNREIFDITQKAIYMHCDYVIMESTAGANAGVYIRLPALTGTFTGVSVAANGHLTKSTSKRDLKYDIQNIINPIDKLKLLNPVTFKWKFLPSDAIEYIKNSETKYGFIAEEVESVDHGLSVYDYIGDEKAVEGDLDHNFQPSFYDIYGIVSILTASLKEAIERIEYLESQISG